ncbi:MAG: M48 family metallopeptidase [Fibromonadaceae bacterium]|jgi:heat shock protein HtpX|nr:M48 family metallopeptidase [Fibromonadaceae bacterium]
MEYVGIATQQSRNNRKSIMLLASFPLLIFALLYIGCFAYHASNNNLAEKTLPYLFATIAIACFALSIHSYLTERSLGYVFFFALLGCIITFLIFSSLAAIFLPIFPRLLVITIIWFAIAYFVDTHIAVFIVILALSYISCFALAFIKGNNNVYLLANDSFFYLLPYVAIGMLIWFTVAYFANVYIIDKATGAHALERRENKLVYNLVENLCISCGMEMPKIHVIETSALNAFASGVSSQSYTLTLTRGIIDSLDDKELEGVIAHELTHIRNNDVRVLIISIVFIGFFDLLTEYSARIIFSSGKRRSRKGKGVEVILSAALVLLLASIGYGISVFMRSAISRNREFMADAGAAELTRDPRALARALRKISGNSVLLEKQSEVIAQLFIEHKSEEGFFAALYKTHPPIEKRIAILEQF